MASSKRNDPNAEARMRRVQGLRFGNAAEPHDKRPNRQRTRADARRAAVRDAS